METLSTGHPEVKSTYQALNETLKPITRRKGARIRTCGSDDAVDIDLEEGRFERGLSSKPPRWIVRVEGSLETPGTLVVDTESGLGHYNLNKGADLIVSRVMILHRDDSSQPWTAFENYECRLVIMTCPPLPAGGSSVVVRVCYENCEKIESDKADDGDAARPISDALASRLMVSARDTPAQYVDVHAAMLICPPLESGHQKISRTTQAALEAALKCTLGLWPLQTVNHDDDLTSFQQLAAIFDELEPGSLLRRTQTHYAPPALPGTIDEAVYRRLHLAVSSGFCHFIVLSNDIKAGQEIVTSLHTAINNREGDTNATAKFPCITIGGDDLEAKTIATFKKTSIGNDGWVILARSQAVVKALLYQEGADDSGICVLKVPKLITGTSLLRQAYQNAGLEPPPESVNFNNNLLYLTWKALQQAAPEYASDRLMDQFFQMCLRLTPSESWDLPVNDQVREIWEDVVAILFPLILGGASRSRKADFLRIIGEAAYLPCESERAVLEIL